MPFQYEGAMYRPPSEAKSLILQATVGCSHNQCTFCSMYKDKKFRIKSKEELRSEIKKAALCYPDAKRVFLADGNALVIPTPDLLDILDLLNASFPLLERVTLYGNSQDLLEKSVTELKDLKKSKLEMVYLGIESGSSDVLAMIKKGVKVKDIAQGAEKAKNAGLKLSVTVINGLAGREGSKEHAEETAALLNMINPHYLSLLSLMIAPGTSICRAFEKGHLTALSPWQLLEEVRQVVAALNLSGCIFRTNHASNYLPLKAVLSEEKHKVLALLDRVIEKGEPAAIRSEFLRRL